MASRSFISLMSRPAMMVLPAPGRRQQEPQSRLRQHLHVDRLDLVRQGADAGKADGELAVVRVGEADAGRLDQQTELLSVGGVDCTRGHDRLPNQSRSLFEREYCLVWRAVRESNTAFVAGSDESDSL